MTEAREGEDMTEVRVDEQNAAYQNFLDCFIRGASLQDIYSDYDKGFGVRRRGAELDDATRARLARACRVQFDRIFSHAANLADPIDRMIGLQGKQVLDFGSGTGALAVAVAMKGASVTATDPTRLSLDACEWRARYFKLDEGAVRTVEIGVKPGLPFSDGSFDMVTCNSVFEFIPARRDEYVRELVRVLRPGGHLVLSTENGLYPVDYYTRRLFPLFRREQMQRLNMPYGMTYFELRRWAKSSGRRLVDRSLMNEFNSMDNVVARRRLSNPGAGTELLNLCNTALKHACRALGVPSQLLFPYTTFVFEMH
jgi:2-polyprenyl-3-methyl-5-hydroxy-6-metoxy-1,4-benzoquinol methylase